MELRYYVDEEDGMWYVFDSHMEPHKAISSWCSKEDAQEDADERNNMRKNSLIFSEEFFDIFE
jgi:hypothetical protein